MLTRISNAFKSIGWGFIFILAACGVYKVYEWGFVAFVKYLLWISVCLAVIMGLLAYLKYRMQTVEYIEEPEQEAVNHPSQYQSEDTEDGRFWYKTK